MKLFKKTNKNENKNNVVINQDHKITVDRKTDIIIAIISLVASILLWLYVVGKSV